MSMKTTEWPGGWLVVLPLLKPLGVLLLGPTPPTKPPARVEGRTEKSDGPCDLSGTDGRPRNGQGGVCLGRQSYQERSSDLN